MDREQWRWWDGKRNMDTGREREKKREKERLVKSDWCGRDASHMERERERERERNRKRERQRGW